VFPIDYKRVLASAAPSQQHSSISAQEVLLGKAYRILGLPPGNSFPATRGGTGERLAFRLSDVFGTEGRYTGGTMYGLRRAFCHHGCPLNNVIPHWNDLVYHERWQDASRMLHARTTSRNSPGISVPPLRDLLRARDQ